MKTRTNHGAEITITTSTTENEILEAIIPYAFPKGWLKANLQNATEAFRNRPEWMRKITEAARRER